MTHHTRRLVWLLLLTALYCVGTCRGALIPGSSPIYHEEGESVEFVVNSIRSPSVTFPKDYYSLPFCKPSEVKTLPSTLGEILHGDRRHNSLYNVSMLSNKTCLSIPKCEIGSTASEKASAIRKLEKAITQGYRGYMSIDDLPIFTSDAHVTCAGGKSTESYVDNDYGYALGVPKTCANQTLINNHLAFRIEYNTKEKDDSKYMIVGVSVSAHSVAENSDTYCNEDFALSGAAPLSLDAVAAGAPLHWSYSVMWVLNPDVLWPTRWDAYFKNSEANAKISTHWLYICLGVALVLLVSGSVAALLTRALHKDFNRYNSTDPEDMQEETGWKLVHADVFRPPDRAYLLSILTGNGVQLLFMVAFLLVLSFFGLLAPTRRGSLLSSVIFLFIFSSFVGGYTCGVLLKYLNCQSWKHVFTSSVAFPSLVVMVYLFGDVLSMIHGATTVVPFTTLLLLFVLWMFLNVPLCVLGASFAFHQDTITNPVRVGRLAREIPMQHPLNQFTFMFTAYPIFPLCTAVLELRFTMQSLWAGQVYYVFYFLFVVFVLWVIMCAMVTVFQLYYVLCYENHRWWWIAFTLPGGFGAHMFVYAIWFYATELSISTFSSALLYFLYMAVVSVGYGLMAGAIGLFSGISFVRLIYGNIKVD